MVLRENIVIVSDSTKKAELDVSGLIEFEDYIYEKYVGKKIVVVYGNCHTIVIQDYLEKCPEFSKCYAIYRIKPIQDIKESSYFDEPIFRYCDVFIHQSIQNGNRYGEKFASENIIKLLKPDCWVIAVPNVYRLPVCFFPQYTREKEYKKKGGGTIFFRDKLLDDYAKEGIPYRKAYRLYINDRSFSDTILENMFDEFLKKVEMREKDWDIKCLDFIKNNYQTHQLFYDPNHPTNFFILYIVKELLRFMKILFDESYMDKLDVKALTAFEMPILPEVKHCFGMTFPDNENMRKMGMKVKQIKIMTVEDYVSQYLACVWKNEDVALIYRIKSYLRYYIMRLYNIRWLFRKVLNLWK